MEQSYYAVIPANVRYDRRLKPIERLLYGEITALTNKEGFCFAKNNYFSQLYECTTRAVRMYLNHLQECGYITILVENKNSRKIFLITADEEEERALQGEERAFQGEEKTFRGVGKNFPGGRKELSGGEERTFLPYNKEYNNTTNNTSNNPPISPHEKNDDWEKAWEAFIEMRKKLKSPLTDRAKQMLIHKLDGLTSSVKEQIAILNQSTINAWKSVYPLHDERGSPNKQDTWEGVTRL